MLTRPDRLGIFENIAADADNELFLSAASSWEIAIKYSIGRLELPVPPGEYIPDRISATGVVPIAISHADVLQIAGLPMHHKDPFDRLLVAQALERGLTIVTADSVLARYGADLLQI